MTGTIPTELGQLDRVTYMDLEFNNLSGGIPSELSMLGTATNGSLDYFFLEGNALTGSVPAGLCSLNTTEFDCSDRLCGCDCECVAP